MNESLLLKGLYVVCFSLFLQGISGYLTLLLPQPILVSAITIEHISQDVAKNISSAPREFEVIGYENIRDLDEARRESEVEENEMESTEDWRDTEGEEYSNKVQRR